MMTDINSTVAWLLTLFTIKLYYDVTTRSDVMSHDDVDLTRASQNTG